MYTAIVCKPTYEKLEGSDNLLVANINGYQVLTNIECIQSELKIFFPSGGIINHDLLRLTNSYRAKYGLNKDPNHPGGFFEDHKRIRSIRMRGTNSEGILFPLSSLELLDIDTSKIKKDQQLNAITNRNGDELILCSKFVPTHMTRVKVVNSSLYYHPSQVPDFQQHIDTLQFRQNTRIIPDGTAIFISEKEHGTSGRTGFLPVLEELPDWKLFLNRFLPDFLEFKAKEEYQIVSGTRRTILKPNTGDWYRQHATEVLTPFIQKDWTIYYEIVGYEVKTADQEPPFKPLFSHSVDKKTQKTLYKTYGPKVDYLYNATEQFPIEVVVYRIHDGSKFLTVDEMAALVNSWDSGIIRPMTYSLLDPCFTNTEENVNQLISEIEKIIKLYHTKWTKHPSEGVCLHLETNHLPDSKKIMKWKSFEFSLLEEIAYSNKDYIDHEEIS